MEHLSKLGRDLAMGSQSAAGSSKDFLDLVKAIGEAKSKAEEDRIMAGEQEYLKKKLAEPDIPKRRLKEYIVRLMYLEVLGHDASWGYIYAVKVAHDENLLLKRTGYLAVTLFLNDSHDLIILIVNTIQKDLKSDNHLVVCAALAAALKLINEETIPAVLNQVVDLLAHPKENVRKKAVMVLQRFYQRSPSSVSHLLPKFRQALCDKDPSVMAASLCGLHDLLAADPSPYRNLAPSFVSILKQVVEGRLPSTYNYHKTPAPFIQIKLLKLLAMLGAGDQTTSEAVYGVLGDVIKRGDSRSTIGNAILYECICTAAAIVPNTPLLQTCAEMTTRFLKSESHNLKYMGIDALSRVVAINPDVANEHQIAVIDCLEDPDDTLKRKTLDLLYKMTGPSNVEVIVEHMLTYLRLLQTSDAHAHGRADLASRLVELAERYAPSNQWFIQTMSSVFEVAGDVVRPKVAHDLMRLIAEGSGGDDDKADKQLRLSAVQSYVKLLQEPSLPILLVEVICWVLGEYATSDGEMRADDVLSRLCDVAERHASSDTVKGYALAAMAKILAFERASGRRATLTSDVHAFVDDMCASHSTDLQQRAYELKALLQLPPATLAAVLPLDGSCEDVEINQSLPFLQSFVNQAIASGAAQYLSESDRFNLGSHASSTSSSLLALPDPSSHLPPSHERSLRFEAYEQPRLPAAPIAIASSSSNYPSSSLVPAGDPYRQDGRAGGSGGGRGGDLFGEDPTRLKLQGVQKKWGRQSVHAGRAEEPIDTAVQSGGSGHSGADMATGSSHAQGGFSEARGGFGVSLRERSAPPEVPEEKVKMAAMLFGAKKGGGGAGGSAATSGGDFTSSSSTAPSDGAGGRSGPWGRKGGSRGGREEAGGQSTAATAANGASAGTTAAAAAPPATPAPPVADLMLLDLGDDQPGGTTAAHTAASAAVASPAPAADPFMKLEGLSVSGTNSLLDAGATLDPLGLGDLTSLTVPAAGATGDLLGTKQGAKDGSTPKGLQNSDSVKGTAAAAASAALKRDAVVRKVGIISPTGGASAELFKDILG